MSPYEVRQTRAFVRAYKKLAPAVKDGVGRAVDVIVGNPECGTRKRGDLSDLRVYKFHSADQLYLLAYTLDPQPRLIFLEAVGPHENFYRDLKRK